MMVELSLVNDMRLLRIFKLQKIILFGGLGIHYVLICVDFFKPDVITLKLILTILKCKKQL